MIFELIRFLGTNHREYLRNYFTDTWPCISPRYSDYSIQYRRACQLYAVVWTGFKRGAPPATQRPFRKPSHWRLVRLYRSRCVWCHRRLRCRWKAMHMMLKADYDIHKKSPLTPQEITIDRAMHWRCPCFHSFLGFKTKPSNRYRGPWLLWYTLGSTYLVRHWRSTKNGKQSHAHMNSNDRDVHFIPRPSAWMGVEGQNLATISGFLHTFSCILFSSFLKFLHKVIFFRSPGQLK